MKVMKIFFMMWFGATMGLFSEIKLKTTEVWTIGREDSGVLFTMPMEILVNSHSRVYVREFKRVQMEGMVSFELLTFEADGKAGRTIGRRGQGPNEFSNITCMTVGRNDDIYLFDNRTQRITVIDSAGKNAGSYRFPENEWKEFSFIHQNTEGDIVLLNPYQKNGEQNLFEVYPPGFRGMKSAFGPVSRFIDPSEKYYRKFNSNFKAAAVDGVGYVLTPVFYTGKVFLIDLRKGVSIRELAGRKPGLKTLEYLSAEEMNKLNQDIRESQKKGKSLPVRIMSQYESGQEIHLKIHNQSLGLFFTGQHIIHFIEIDNGKRFEKWIDVYTSEGDYQGSTDISNQYPDPESFRPLAFDREGNFYFTVVGPDEFPLIRKVRWHLELSIP